ncbi:MAG: tRNA pseudouridine(54/55) synthase Pus10 [Nanohaloarchaea archaeon SW_4_43_9]|nr:MAG: tRNA pseudouridine(54/55) synthase Pus10 [Nanohaloarchaea archaeon SW_4_43_9]
MYTVQEKRDLLLEEDLCDHCLGRQFAKLGHGLENYERGAIIREKDEVNENSFARDNIPEEAEPGSSCHVCQEVFEKMDHWVELVEDSFERYELDTFLIGIRPPSDVLKAEEELWEEYGLEWVEPIKTELSRLIGKRLEEELGIEVDFKRPDINAIIEMEESKDRVEMQVNSLLIYGQYNKYSREIPQTEWHCRNCRGDGCDECDWTGKQYTTSVQEEIQDPFMRETKGIEAKFHGGGREDVNARCLGKREFVLEIIEPLNRNLDLKELQEEVNESTDKIEVFELQFTHKDKAADIKQKHADKEYKAVIETEDEITEEDLDNISKAVGEIKQDTPERVEHRRADKTRKREIYEVEWEKTGDKEFELTVKAEAGTYIKELIHGDEGRTQPNVSELIGTSAECVQLDVTWIEK